MLEIELPELHPAQRQVWDHPARFHVMSCGRRFGKSRLAALVCITTALRGRRAWWVAPSYPMASVGWRMVRRLAVQIPGAVIRESERMVIMPTGGTVQIRSADNPDSLRGEGLDLAVLDECAFMDERAWTEALRPALADRKGDAIFCSTPKGRNWFWRLWSNADGEQWKAWRFTSYDNPHIDPAEIDAAKATLPERVFRQEFLAEFLDESGSVFRRVLESATATPQDSAVEGHTYLIGVDWGRTNDSTCFAVLDLDTQELVYLDRFTQVDYALQVNRLKALYQRFAPAIVIAESNSMGMPLIESLQREDVAVIPFTTTNASKQIAVDALALAFEQGAIRIIPDPVLLHELQAYEMERLPSGMLRYSAPAGDHDDCVMGLLLAWQGAANHTPLIW